MIGPYWWLLIPGLLFGLWAQWKVKSAFAKYSQVPASGGLTGAEAAMGILQGGAAEVTSPGATASLQAVRIEAIGGTLTDHYDPRTKVLRLSAPVYGGTSLAALGVAAHEAGHALQHATGYGPLGMRSSLLPVANIGSQLAIPLVFIGMLLSFNQTLINLGILFYLGAVIFTLLTLPVEFNASRRALTLLEGGGYLRREEIPGAKAVLNAAALTYVAAALAAILTLVQLLLLRDARD
jgi:Zn-dependent membrane protease YugP